ncbi:uncharacterized protein EDB91DRAFT_122092 [Suillus paluster]|uniref:uncharacterized protein n=1 Tax=Suillus paluster TaxID=48578 RepID=UPI001B87C769|nr:uncharacterized protein EDB91DRAFT_122092 [Suillus paluster]KAG1724695.1 hypothetical protein EDB91DRAFT_122092 [Suillus paluster]
MSNQAQNLQVSSKGIQRPRLVRPDSDSDDLFFQGFPSTWDPPTFCISKWAFKICCVVFTFHGDLIWLYYLLSTGDNWEELHTQYLSLLGQLSTIQGLVLATVAVFISSNPPLPQDVDYSSGLSYACLAESLVFSLFGLLYQLHAFFAATRYQKRATTKVIIFRRWRIFWHLLGLAVPVILFFISVVLMIVAIGFTGFLSQSTLVQTYMTSTLAFIGACHMVSILSSPPYHYLIDLCTHHFGRQEGAKAPLEHPEVGRVF